MHIHIWSENLKGRDHLEDSDVWCRCQDYIKIDLREIAPEVVDWIQQAQVSKFGFSEYGDVP